MMESLHKITLTIEEGIAVLTLDNPSQLNALSTEVLCTLEATCETISANEGVRAVVIRSSTPKAFVAGADITEMKDMNADEALEYGWLGNRVFLAIERLPIPVIAAIGGYALGGGFELALACDLRVAADTAVFAFPETGLGVIPGFGGTQRTQRLIGQAKAAELIYTGRRVKADEALMMGLVNSVVSAAELDSAAMALAQRIAANAPLAVRNAKRALLGGAGLELEEALEHESAWFSKCFSTQDQKNAMDAFANKRKLDGFVGK